MDDVTAWFQYDNSNKEIGMKHIFSTKIMRSVPIKYTRLLII